MAKQSKPNGKGESIFPLVIKDLQEREKAGIETYGESLRANNGRNALQDLYEELLDAALYVKQAMVEATTNERVYFVSPGALYDAWRKPGTFVPFKPLPMEGYVSSDLPLPCAGEGPANIPAADPESIAQEAHRLVLGDRGEAYGHPIFDMTRTADMLTALLRDKLRPGQRLEAEDIAQAMICVKQSRERNQHKRDNQTDTAGYALTKEMIGEWRAANPGVDPRDVFPTT